MKVLVLFGTRPEVIKLAPVVRELRSHPRQFVTRIIATGQHQEMARQALDAFHLQPDVELNAMAAGTSLGSLTARLLEGLDRAFESETPDWLLVQGDTTSAMVGALTAFYRRVRVGHVEAGLRTYNRFEPFPEEINRTFISHLADLHFAPTQGAAENLRKLGVRDEAIHVTGNTAVDALLWASSLLADHQPPGLEPSLGEFIQGKRLVLVTSHRRESIGEGLENICRGLLAIVERYPDVVIVFPVHLNPDVRIPVRRMLGNHPRIRLIEPTGYLDLVWLMRRSFCIFTDSGGIQEEAPSLGKPIFIMRDRTERPEVVTAGCARIVGTSTKAILEGARDVFEVRTVYEAMTRAGNPFGDGDASSRIVNALLRASGDGR